MSQAKVDRYKEYKKNRKENIAKEKRKALRERILGWSVVGVFALFLVGAVAYKGVDAYKKAEAAKPDYTATSYVLPDMNGLGTEETEGTEE